MVRFPFRKRKEADPGTTSNLAARRAEILEARQQLEDLGFEEEGEASGDGKSTKSESGSFLSKFRSGGKKSDKRSGGIPGLKPSLKKRLIKLEKEGYIVPDIKDLQAMGEEEQDITIDEIEHAVSVIKRIRQRIKETDSEGLSPEATFHLISIESMLKEPLRFTDIISESRDLKERFGIDLLSRPSGDSTDSPTNDEGQAANSESQPPDSELADLEDMLRDMESDDQETADKRETTATGNMIKNFLDMEQRPAHLRDSGTFDNADRIRETTSPSDGTDPKEKFRGIPEDMEQDMDTTRELIQLQKQAERQERDRKEKEDFLKEIQELKQEHDAELGALEDDTDPKLLLSETGNGTNVEWKDDAEKEREEEKEGQTVEKMKEDKEREMKIIEGAVEIRKEEEEVEGEEKISAKMRNDREKDVIEADLSKQVDMNKQVEMDRQERPDVDRADQGSEQKESTFFSTVANDEEGELASVFERMRTRILTKTGSDTADQSTAKESIHTMEDLETAEKSIAASIDGTHNTDHEQITETTPDSDPSNDYGKTARHFRDMVRHILPKEPASDEVTGDPDSDGEQTGAAQRDDSDEIVTLSNQQREMQEIAEEESSPPPEEHITDLFDELEQAGKVDIDGIPVPQDRDIGFQHKVSTFKHILDGEVIPESEQKEDQFDPEVNVLEDVKVLEPQVKEMEKEFEDTEEVSNIPTKTNLENEFIDRIAQAIAELDRQALPPSALFHISSIELLLQDPANENEIRSEAEFLSQISDIDLLSPTQQDQLEESEADAFETEYETFETEDTFEESQVPDLPETVDEETTTTAPRQEESAALPAQDTLRLLDAVEEDMSGKAEEDMGEGAKEEMGNVAEDVIEEVEEDMEAEAEDMREEMEEDMEVEAVEEMEEDMEVEAVEEMEVESEEEMEETDELRAEQDDEKLQLLLDKVMLEKQILESQRHTLEQERLAFEAEQKRIQQELDEQRREVRQRLEEGHDHLHKQELDLLVQHEQEKRKVFEEGEQELAIRRNELNHLYEDMDRQLTELEERRKNMTLRTKHVHRNKRIDYVSNMIIGEVLERAKKEGMMKRAVALKRVIRLETILSIAISQGGITRSSMQQLYGTSHSTSERDMTLLKQLGLIRFRGARKNGQYVLTEKAQVLIERHEKHKLME